MATPSGSARPVTEPSNLLFNLLAITLTLAALGLGLAYLIDAGRRVLDQSAEAADSQVLLRTLGGKDLRIPAGLFRHPQDQAEGFVERIDLRFGIAPGGMPGTVDVTLQPRSKTRPSTGLLDAVYLHQFAPEQRSGPVGLVGKPLKNGNGYTGETVWYDPLSGAPFVAKCLAAVQPERPARCLRTVVLSPTIGATYAFDEQLLANWRDFDAELSQQLGRIGVF